MQGEVRRASLGEKGPASGRRREQDRRYRAADADIVKSGTSYELQRLVTCKAAE